MNYYLRYQKPAQNSYEGWRDYSIPLGNGYMGINVFGGTELERMQITENSMVNPSYRSPDNTVTGHAGLTNFGEIYVKFPHEDVTDYERGLHLNKGVAYTKYKVGAALYQREYFTSYPDKVLVTKLSCSQKGGLSFEVCPEIPFVRDYLVCEGDGMGKSGQVSVDGDCITLWGELSSRHILFEWQVKVITDGRMTQTPESICVSGADEAVIITAVGTNYKLCPETFLNEEGTKKVLGEDPHEKVSAYLAEASARSYEELYQRHTEEFSSFFDRVSLDLGEQDGGRMTDELLQEYKEGKKSRYLEALYFQYGRYLLISSSRKGCLPANLQGIWTCFERSPWGCGYWHNINVQMNYWPAFNTNLIEMFESYADFFQAFYPCAQRNAEEYVQTVTPENYKKGECGMSIGTAVFPYSVSGQGLQTHSGPGTTAFTSILFWDYYDFTREEKILRDVSYKALESVSKFLTKTVKKYDGEYLVQESASPEQRMKWSPKHYHTIGCTFDQQMIYENGKDFIKASEILGIQSEALDIQKEQIDLYHPVRIGWSGQVKEYWEENFYGDIGDSCHRHISHLVGLYPGTLINSRTDAWLDAAKVTLTERGFDRYWGWSSAHKLNTWARAGEGNHCHEMIDGLLSRLTAPNLWDIADCNHLNEYKGVFQIDANLGATAGVAEMLLQSHEDCLHILPALPDIWANGRVTGLTARGAFEADIEWSDRAAKKVVIRSKKGNRVRIKSDFGEVVTVNGENMSSALQDGILELDTQAGGSYEILGFAEKAVVELPKNLEVTDDLKLTWEGGACDLFRAVDDAPVYECIARNVESPYQDDYDFAGADIITYKAAVGGKGVTKTINHATQRQKTLWLKNITCNEK